MDILFGWSTGLYMRQKTIVSTSNVFCAFKRNEYVVIDKYFSHWTIKKYVEIPEKAMFLNYGEKVVQMKKVDRMWK